MSRRTQLTLVLALVLGMVLLVVVIRLQEPDSPTSDGLPPGLSAADIRAHNAAVGLMGRFDFPAAVTALDAIVARYPTWRVARVNRALALLNRARPDTKDIDRALEVMRAVLEEDPQNLRAHHAIGLILLYRGQMEAALPFFAFVAKQDPTDPHAAYFLGDCHRQLDQVDEAIGWFEEARRRDPYLRSAYHALFQSLRWAGREEEASEMFALFKKLEDNPQARVAEVKYTRMGRHALLRTVDLPDKAPGRRPQGPLLEDPFEDPSLLAIANGSDLLWVANAERASISAADIDGDGLTDLFLCGVLHGERPNLVLLRRADGTFEAALDHVFGALPGVEAALFGDYDNDGRMDACFCCAGRNRLLRQGEQGWEDVTEAAGLPAAEQRTRDGAFVDLDHDGDLDLLFLHAETAFEALFNKGDGTFGQLPASAGLEGQNPQAPERPATGIVLGDFDHDRDLDLLVLHATGGHEVFINDRLWSWHTDPNFDALLATPAHTGISFDGDADGQQEIYLAHADGVQRWVPNDDGTWVASRFVRNKNDDPRTHLGVMDADGDGLLDLLLVDQAGARLYAQDGSLIHGDPSQIVPVDVHATPLFWSAEQGHALVGLSPSGAPIAWLPGPGRSPFAALTFSGLRKKSASMRSNASGIGTRVAARTGSRWTVRDTYRNFSGPGQSLQPLSLGLNGEAQVDFVDLLWTDGLLQTENNLAAGQVHAIEETQRQTSSCPVLFVWNGKRYEFVSDLLGVGGVGFWVAPETYVPPTPRESFLLPAGVLQPQGEEYVLKIGEPMEEACYLDHAQLEIHDLPPGWSMTLDERMHVSGPAPTGEPIFYQQTAVPVTAVNHARHDMRPAILHADLLAAEVTHIDHHLIGRTTQEQVLTLTFAEPIDHGRPVLVTDGWIEYPYAQTMFAAWQAGATYDAPTIEALGADGAWHLVLKNYGYPAGMPRQSSVPLPNLPQGTIALRLRTNQEVYWDRLFVAFAREVKTALKHVVPLRSARLLEPGFALRTTNAQRLPHYDRARCSPLWNTRHQAGWYTKFGEVRELLAKTDDAVVILGPGEEVELRFPRLKTPLPPGFTRHVVLLTTGWCKDQDLFTLDGETLAPLPVRAESGEADAARAQLHPQYQTRYRSGR